MCPTARRCLAICVSTKREEGEEDWREPKGDDNDAAGLSETRAGGEAHQEGEDGECEGHWAKKKSKKSTHGDSNRRAQDVHLVCHGMLSPAGFHAAISAISWGCCHHQGAICRTRLAKEGWDFL